MSYYDVLFLIIINGSDYSVIFITTNGVKQGGVISPKLYTIYGTFIIRGVKLLLIGFKLGNMIISIIVYADDTTLVANKPKDMQTLLDTVGNQGNKDDILFNGKKSAILIINNKNNETYEFKLNGLKIPIVEEIKLLGYVLTNKSNDKKHIIQRKNKALSAINKLRLVGLISSKLSIYTRAHLFKTFIRPVLFYGIDNATLDMNDLELIRKTDSMLLKNMLCINKQCHNSELYRALSITDPMNKIIKDKLSLFSRLMEYDYTKNFIKELNKNQVKTDFIKDIDSCLHIETSQFDNEIIKQLIKNKISNDKKISNEISKNDELIKNLKKALTIKNHELFLRGVWACIGFKKEKYVRKEG